MSENGSGTFASGRGHQDGRVTKGNGFTANPATAERAALPDLMAECRPEQWPILLVLIGA